MYELFVAAYLGRIFLFSQRHLLLTLKPNSHGTTLKGFLFYFFFMYVIQHFFIFRPSDSTVSEDAGILPRTDATLTLTARRSHHTARSHPRNDFKTLKILLSVNRFGLSNC